MQIPGQRFEIDLDDPDDSVAIPRSSANLFDLVGEIKERHNDDAAAESSEPKPPVIKHGTFGFPSHRKRPIVSKFKAQKLETDKKTAEEVAHPPPMTEKQQIDHENRNRIAGMSPVEIEEARRDLMASLNPKILQRLLARSNIDPTPQPTEFPGIQDDDMQRRDVKDSAAKPHEDAQKITKPAKKVSFAPETANTMEEKEVAAQSLPSVKTSSSSADDKQHADSNSKAGEEHLAPEKGPSMHWPKPSQRPSLDPAAPNFLEDLHSKYFPDLPAEPEKLEWMKESSVPSTYTPNQTGLDPKHIRFSFSGTLIPPSMAAKIPVTEGLHHHGEAPEAAGYTIAELGILARSSVAAQRCIAFQTLGRIFFRLGKGEFGNPSEDSAGVEDRAETMGELARGLWDEVTRAAVVDICVAESEGRGPGMGRHASAKAYATEAVWLWQKGGGRRWTAA